MKFRIDFEEMAPVFAVPFIAAFVLAPLYATVKLGFIVLHWLWVHPW